MDKPTSQPLDQARRAPDLTSTQAAESSWDDPEDAMLDASEAVTLMTHLIDSELTERLVWGSAWPALTAQFTFDEAMDILDTCLQGKPEATKPNCWAPM